MVPSRHYAYMLQILAARLAATDGNPDPAGPTEIPLTAPAQASTQIPAQAAIPIPTSTVKGWTHEEIRELRRLIAHNATATAMFDLTCAKPGQRVTFEEVFTHAGRTHSTAKADLSAFSRVKNMRFGKNRGWPVDWQTIDGGHLIYWAHALLAKWWNEKE
jgi:hypothetical protein